MVEIDAPFRRLNEETVSRKSRPRRLDAESRAVSGLVIKEVRITRRDKCSVNVTKAFNYVISALIKMPNAVI